ncbi:metallophosphoesterase family protein [Kordiimonas pumila]|uniref:Metallophosphoesterase family protein n=1 Tax=Kordiimonas pumila TaxID=2161677 RepID=A0ABV7D4C0_9PROT|nr:metallophosphoesterase [Kordiimonas pumila]
MKLFAISDLHLSNPSNLEAFLALKEHAEDWLILGGDIAERPETLEIAFRHAVKSFACVIWVPGNHELWALPDENGEQICGVARYEHLVELARAYGVLTPEDPFIAWPGSLGDHGAPLVLAPLFLLYDYSFGPEGMSHAEIVAWAREMKCVAADEHLLASEPYVRVEDWCADRIKISEQRLSEIEVGSRTVLINHFPMRKDLIHIPRVPRFIPWCGTAKTENWHNKYNAEVVVTGHLHVRRTDWRDQTRFEEVSLGYPKQWDQAKGVAPYLRQILPYSQE